MPAASIHAPAGRLAALFAALLLSLAPHAAAGQTAPRIAVTGIPLDDRPSLSGAIVRTTAEEERARLVDRAAERTRAEQTYHIRPALWRIRDRDTVIYLFGTIHALPPGFRWRTPALERAIAAADSLLLESLSDEGDRVTFLEGMPEAAALPPLIDRVSAPYRRRLAEYQALLPQEAVDQLDRMPTWIAAMAVGYVKDLASGEVPGPGADDWLEQNFRARGRPVEAIEDSRAVISTLNAVPEPAQRLMLEAAIDAPVRSHAELSVPVHAWARGDTGPHSPLIIAPTDIDPSAALTDPLVARRNLAWAGYLARRMDRPGTVLFAAGAGHFVGPGSVIELLRNRGFLIERVQ
ncbi:MAG: TraB/GumN family protein [Pseudomonadota bacterium]